GSAPARLTMAATPEPEASLVARPRSGLSALRPSARFRAQLVRAGVVVLVVVGIFGTLTLAFGISVLQYALGGLVISSIVIVVAVCGMQHWLYPVSLGQDFVIVPGLGIHPIRGILTLSVGLILLVAAQVLLKYTNLGKAMRATADNLELAKATGIDTRRVTYAAWAVSCSFASIAGVLLGLGSALSPTVGFESLLLIFAAVIVGGIGSPYGAMLGGLLVG